MNLKIHQTRTLNQLLKHDKSFVFWPRQAGKTYLIIAFLEQFVQNNKDQNILFIGANKNILHITIGKILTEIGNLTVDKHRTGDLYFINNNFVKFCCYDECTLEVINLLTPSLIIYDEIWISDIIGKLVAYYIKMSNCKCIFTSTRIALEMIEYFDYKNDFYINIIPNYNNDDYDVYKKDSYDEIIKELSYKPVELLDFYDLIYQRRNKLKKINQISNGR